MKPRWWDDAARELARRDRVMRRLVRAHPGVSLKRRSDAFTALARAITGQQISVKAADAIWRRLVLASRRSARMPAFPKLDPAAIAALGLPALREAGYSGRKATYVADLAAHFVSGALDPRAWRRMDDEALIAALTEVRGIGRWTAEMFLMFGLVRPDVWPVDDLGLRAAVKKMDGLTEMPAKVYVMDRGEAYAPYRTVACWYLWQSLKE